MIICERQLGVYTYSLPSKPIVPGLTWAPNRSSVEIIIPNGEVHHLSKYSVGHRPYEPCFNHFDPFCLQEMAKQLFNHFFCKYQEEDCNQQNHSPSHDALAPWCPCARPGPLPRLRGHVGVHPPGVVLRGVQNLRLRGPARLRPWSSGVR